MNDIDEKMLHLYPESIKKYDSLIMPYAIYGNLLEYKLNNDMSIKLIKKIFLQIASGLKYIHNKNIVHRDMSLDNVLVFNDKDDLNVKISDLGTMVPANSPIIRVGKSNYVPQTIYMYNKYKLKQNIKHLKSIDIHALGVILFALLTRSFPYSVPDCKRDTGYNMVCKGKELFTQLIRLWKLMKFFDNDSIDLISRMLHINWERRPTLEEIITHPFFTKCKAVEIVVKNNIKKDIAIKDPIKIDSHMIMKAKVI